MAIPMFYGEPPCFLCETPDGDVRLAEFLCPKHMPAFVATLPVESKTQRQSLARQLNARGGCPCGKIHLGTGY